MHRRYHVTPINKGVNGEFSKIKEEFEEAQDAYFQGNMIMVLIELSDMLGATENFLKRYCPSIDLDDLVVMGRATNEAFQ